MPSLGETGRQGAFLHTSQHGFSPEPPPVPSLPVAAMIGQGPVLPPPFLHHTALPSSADDCVWLSVPSPAFPCQ